MVKMVQNAYEMKKSVKKQQKYVNFSEKNNEQVFVLQKKCIQIFDEVLYLKLGLKFSRQSRVGIFLLAEK